MADVPGVEQPRGRDEQADDGRREISQEFIHRPAPVGDRPPCRCPAHIIIAAATSPTGTSGSTPKANQRAHAAATSADPRFVVTADVALSRELARKMSSADRRPADRMVSG
jgi:hypothetical protein